MLISKSVALAMAAVALHVPLCTVLEAPEKGASNAHYLQEDVY